jgi:hypothetical protein
MGIGVRDSSLLRGFGWVLNGRRSDSPHEVDVGNSQTACLRESQPSEGTQEDGWAKVLRHRVVECPDLLRYGDISTLLPSSRRRAMTCNRFSGRFRCGDHAAGLAVLGRRSNIALASSARVAQ